MGTTRRKRTLGVRGLTWEAYMSCRVDRGFPCRVYINSNRGDSRI
jgi:hypothetical protein